jgi:hypothetical protein
MMNKKLINSILFGSLLMLGVVSCKNSSDKQLDLKKEDSLANIQSNEALDRANELLNSDTAVVDSTQRTK